MDNKFGQKQFEKMKESDEWMKRDVTYEVPYNDEWTSEHGFVIESEMGTTDMLNVVQKSRVVSIPMHRVINIQTRY